MKTRILQSVIAACALLASACDSGSNTGTMTVRLTDAPFPFSEVAGVDIFVVRVDAKTEEPTENEASDDDDMTEWTTIATPNAVIDLLDLANGTTTNLGETTLPTGTYRGFRLIIDPAQSSVTLNDGSHPDIVWPSAARTGIKIKLDQPISLTENGSVVVVDFDVGRSFVMRGNSIRNNGLLFKPVLRGTATDITGTITGEVRQDNATGTLVSGATVELLTAGTLVTDTDDAKIVATTVTGTNGAFTLAFVRPGTYELRATPPTGSTYKPALLTGGVTVGTSEAVTGKIIVVQP